MFPRGIPSAALPDAVTSALRTCSSRASRMLGSLSLASSGHLTPHGQPGGGIRPPGSAPLHRLPARRPPPSRRSSAPRPAASCFVPHTMPPAPKIPVAMLWELRFGCVFRVVHIARSRGHLRALRRQVLSSSFPALPRSCLTCAAWSFLRDHLTPRPAVAKSTYRFCVRKIRYAPALQNPGNGAGDSLQFLGCRAKSARGKPRSTLPTPAACRGGTRFPAPVNPAPSPALGRSGAGCRKIAHPAPHGPTLDQQSQAAFLRKSLLFKESALSLAVSP
jgi:hypothetical protein